MSQHGRSKTKTQHDELTSIRLRLFQNGYHPILCHGKVPAMAGWNSTAYVTEQLHDGPRGSSVERIESWRKRFSQAVTTGVRIEGGLLVIDIDIDDFTAVEALLMLIAAIAPEVAGLAPTRYGGGEKMALFCKVEGEDFIRIASHKYRRPTDAVDKYHAVEIFGGRPFRSGVCSRQFAIYGPRSYDGDGKVTSEYVWAEGVPELADVRLDDLPRLTKPQAYAIAAAFEEWAKTAGWILVAGLDEGDGEGRDVYDIDRDSSRFEVQHVGEVSYAELEAVFFDNPDIRCTANFIAGEQSTTADRCSVFWSTRHDCIVVKDWKTAARHYPADVRAGPVDEEVAEAIRATAADAGVEIPKRVNWCETYENGKPRPTLRNARLAIAASGIRCSLDTFHNRMFTGRSDAASPAEAMLPFLGRVTDQNLGSLRVYLANRYNRDFTEKHIRDAVTTMASENAFDPVVDMLAEAEASWDGKPRLDRMAVDYFNCEDTRVNRAYVRKTMIAAVARARQPGVKFDTILTMESREGWNKSSAWALLAGEDNFSDASIIGHAGREVQEQLAGVWIHENPELAGLRKAEVEAVKAFASRQVDRARPAYGHFLIEQPRHSIEVATTNAERYMQSYTGNRRFWPIKVLAMIDLRKLRAARQQLWGEAAHYQRQGESLALDEALWPVAGVGQEQRRVEDPWEALIEGMSPMRVEGLTGGVNYYINSAVIHEVSDELRVTTAAIFEHVIKIPSGQQQRHHSTRLSEIMRLHGWRSDVFKLNNASVRGYTKISKKVP